MRPKLIINDVHLGVQRTAGTTPATAQALREYLQTELRKLMLEHTNKDIIINGDLFDSYSVSTFDMLQFYETASLWLGAEFGKANAPVLVLGAGNHDLSKDSSKLSSFEFVASVLAAQWPDRVKVVMATAEIFPGVVMIPHVANQDIFDIELAKAAELENSIVLLHANFDNNFTNESDHSLNVSHEQAARLIDRGNTLVFGHEHQARHAFGGELICTGNQFPSSVADCLNNPGNLKYAHLLQQVATGLYELEPVCTWDGNKHFCEFAWDEINTCCEEAESFVRIVGRATAEQAGDAIAAISKYRQKSQAFVVTNAVRVEGSAEMSELPASMETAKSFDVLAYLFENLDPEEAAVVRGLLAEAEPLKEAA